MSNTINVNYMTRAYNQYQQKNAAKDQEKEDTRFADSVREKSEASGSIVGNLKIGSVSAKDMTMVEYKQYIYNKISQIPMHPTRAGESISVTISEAGFEAMKNDPEYEAWGESYKYYFVMVICSFVRGNVMYILSKLISKKGMQIAAFPKEILGVLVMVFAFTVLNCCFVILLSLEAGSEKACLCVPVL